MGDKDKDWTKSLLFNQTNELNKLRPDNQQLQKRCRPHWLLQVASLMWMRRNPKATTTSISIQFRDTISELFRKILQNKNELIQIFSYYTFEEQKLKLFNRYKTKIWLRCSLNVHRNVISFDLRRSILFLKRLYVVLRRKLLRITQNTILSYSELLTQKKIHVGVLTCFMFKCFRTSL